MKLPIKLTPTFLSLPQIYKSRLESLSDGKISLQFVYARCADRLVSAGRVPYRPIIKRRTSANAIAFFRECRIMSSSTAYHHRFVSYHAVLLPLIILGSLSYHVDIDPMVSNSPPYEDSLSLIKASPYSVAASHNNETVFSCSSSMNGETQRLFEAPASSLTDAPRISLEGSEDFVFKPNSPSYPGIVCLVQGTSVCSGSTTTWAGITCESGVKVVNVNRAGQCLQGTLPAAWSVLVGPTQLGLWSTGPLPSKPNPELDPAARHKAPLQSFIGKECWFLVFICAIFTAAVGQCHWRIVANRSLACHNANHQVRNCDDRMHCVCMRRSTLISRLSSIFIRRIADASSSIAS